ncbi:hypothetical protein L210DRAFT_3652625 [Boletus edulis BED1]|uniref:Uncharacterized protein n=1 Tax=Boletus edulis BED1 TaxID=1328754 RepID=A0AAD4BGP6_BOLED|nr:hypothetical protein L210DRAFT_3652625 [Boletus edulis BED1]
MAQHVYMVLNDMVFTGSRQKSAFKVTRLVHDVLRAPDFSTEELAGFDAQIETHRLDNAQPSDVDNPFEQDKWKCTSVDINIPTREKKPKGNGKTFTVEAREGSGGLMLWSDSTHLATFGHASAWPIYLLFGNLSKYARTRPEGGACHPIAFIPRLPGTIYKFISDLSKKKRNADMVTHCKRELIHAVWRILLDNDFVEAYKNGIVVKCFNGITRRVYPQIFTYSADYPEKVLLATIRDKGICPCPRCLIPKSNFYRQKVFHARWAIYKLGKPLKSVVVERILKAFSLVPTVNTFTERLSHMGFNPSLMVDILFTVVPPFGVDGIRAFPDDVADTSQCPAWYFEDVLQCSMPVLEGLLPPIHEDVVQTLLFCLAEWQALAKLRLHTDDTLTLLHQALRRLGAQVRKFQHVTCTTYQAKELPQEMAQRVRRELTDLQSGHRKKGVKSESLPKMLNINTYKFHALGDYEKTIRLFGTTDSYMTQVGERAHKLIKIFYGASNKRAVEGQFAKQERQGTHIQRQLDQENVLEELEEADSSPLLHHTMTNIPKRDNVFSLPKFLSEHQDDPAFKLDFMSCLKNHLLSRLLGLDYDGDERTFTLEQRNKICLINTDAVVESKTLHINYTTYDIRWDNDMIRTTCGGIVMTYSRDEEHPFWYAQVLRAFHLKVLFCLGGVSQSIQSMEVLWVRWLGIDMNHKWGFKEARLPKVGYVPDRTDHLLFGFLDPSLVIRGCHLIPAFADGRTHELLRGGETLARQPGDMDDWAAFYVNM